MFTRSDYRQIGSAVVVHTVISSSISSVILSLDAVRYDRRSLPPRLITSSFIYRSVCEIVIGEEERQIKDKRLGYLLAANSRKFMNAISTMLGNQQVASGGLEFYPVCTEFVRNYDFFRRSRCIVKYCMFSFFSRIFSYFHKRIFLFSRWR